jgi:hypothetical protein
MRMLVTLILSLAAAAGCAASSSEGEAYIEAPSAAAAPGAELLARANNPHGRGRGTGCTSCHVLYDADHAANEASALRKETKDCDRCHAFTDLSDRGHAAGSP